MTEPYAMKTLNGSNYELTAFLLSLGLFFLTAGAVRAQMPNGQDTLYGFEWIDYDKSWYKFYIAEDGWYRIPYESLQNVLPAGAPT